VFVVEDVLFVTSSVPLEFELLALLYQEKEEIEPAPSLASTDKVPVPAQSVCAITDG
jgi:hypothetical protein